VTGALGVPIAMPVNCGRLSSNESCSAQGAALLQSIDAVASLTKCVALFNVGGGGGGGVTVTRGAGVEIFHQLNNGPTDRPTNDRTFTDARLPIDLRSQPAGSPVYTISPR